jgi:hypothetical protein
VNSTGRYHRTISFIEGHTYCFCNHRHRKTDSPTMHSRFGGHSPPHCSRLDVFAAIVGQPQPKRRSLGLSTHTSPGPPIHIHNHLGWGRDLKRDTDLVASWKETQPASTTGERTLRIEGRWWVCSCRTPCHHHTTRDWLPKARLVQTTCEDQRQPHIAPLATLPIVTLSHFLVELE